jgi:radical SAM-linked protein
LIRELPRVIRRAGVRTAYTNGFHPKPDMSFGPALSLGVASLDEYLDIKLIGAPEPTELVERLNAVAAGGVRFVAAERLSPGEPSLGSTITAARYVIALAEDAVDALGGVTVLAQRVSAFLAQPEARVMRKIDGIGKIVDVRRLVTDLRIGGIRARAALAEAGVVGRAVPLEATIQISQTGSAKVSELMEALLGDAKFPHVALRSALVRRQEATPAALQLA